MRLTGLLVASISLVAIAGCRNDLTVHQRFTFAGTPPGEAAVTTEETEYYSDHMLVIDAPHLRWIVDLKANTATNVNKDERTYEVMTLDEAQRMSTPPDAAGSAATITPTGKSEAIAGHNAKEYVIEAGELSGSLWLTDAFKVSAEARKWGRAAWQMGANRSGSGFAEAFTKLEGLPLRAKNNVMAFEVTDVQPTPAPAETLVVPKDFVKVSGHATQ